MARLRKPEPEPTAPAASSQTGEATIEERTQYLIQEIGKDAGFLETWIIHYLAELFERADDRKATPRARTDARAEIALVIPTLWEQQIAREALHVRQRVDYWLRRTDTLNIEAEHLLGKLLANPGGIADLTEDELPVALRDLHTLSELLTRFFLTTASAAWARHEVTSEAVRRFLQRDEEMQGLQAALARVVPEFAAVDPTALDAVERLAHQTFLALTRAQLSLLTHMVPETEE